LLARIIGGMDVKIICREVCIYIEDTRMDKSGLAFQRERERRKGGEDFEETMAA
jgi:hypothetical protein